jgi:uncharacterized protein
MTEEAEIADISEVNGRLCIVTRQSGSPEGLIRFVAGPDGTAVPDLKHKLPGRGCWVTAERATLEKAMAKNLFARALKANIKVSPTLADEVEHLLAVQLAGMMNMARKAGEFVSGSMKVDNAVRSGAALSTFHAENAAPDGVRKIDQARKAFHLGMETDAEIPSSRPFTVAEMEKLMGENAFIHAAALAGTAGEGVVKRANMLVRFRNSGVVTAGGPAGPRQS